MSTDITTTSNASIGIFADGPIFEHYWRVAKLFASSQLVPKHFQGKPEDCMIALNIAERLRMDPLVIFQSLHVVHGSPGWSAKYLIAQMNRSERFVGGVDFEVTGTGRDMQATARVTLAVSGEVREETVSMEMAAAEGWARNPKYTTMPAVMLRYRAATFLCRFYAPEVLLGIPMADEVEDVAFAERAGPTRVELVQSIPKALSAPALDALRTEPARDPVVVEGQASEEPAQEQAAPDIAALRAALVKAEADDLSGMMAERGALQLSVGLKVEDMTDDQVRAYAQAAGL
jgi:hypothetical protein